MQKQSILEVILEANKTESVESLGTITNKTRVSCIVWMDSCHSMRLKCDEYTYIQTYKHNVITLHD